MVRRYEEEDGCKEEIGISMQSTKKKITECIGFKQLDSYNKEKVHRII